jgi:hypothetical protein
MHATEMFPTICPEISRDAARDVADFATAYSSDQCAIGTRTTLT